MDNIAVAGVDVSKQFSDMCILAPDNTVFSQLHIIHDLAGMSIKAYSENIDYDNFIGFIQGITIK